MNNRHIERIWLAQSFLDDFILIYPVYAIMMLESGVTEFELSLLFVIWSVSALLFEIPSGVIGDLVNRKRYIAVGSFIRAFGYLMWLLESSFTGFALGFVIWTLGSAIHSGTLQSLLHDALAEQNRSAEFARIYGRGKSVQSIGVLVAMALGGFAAQSGYTMVLILSALAPIAAGLLLLLGVSEPARTHRSSAEVEFSTTLAVALRSLLGNPSLLLVCVMFVFLLGAAGVVDEYIGPLLAEGGGLTLGVIGVIYGLVLGSRAVGTSLAHRFGSLPLARVSMAGVFAHLLLLVGVLFDKLWLAIFCAIYFAVMGALEVLLETSMQNEIDVHARATIASVAGAGLEIWGICLYLLIGYAAGLTSWAGAIIVVALLAVALSALLSYLAGPVAARNRS